MGSDTGYEIRIVFRAKVSEFVRYVEVVELVSEWGKGYCVYFFDLW